MSPRSGLAWAAAALVALVELGIAGLVLRPHVDPLYRAYYIDHSSDCWPHRTAAAYTPGTTLSFLDPRQGADFMANKICGWSYPNRLGTWSYGAYSLLRFNFPPAPQALTLTVVAAGLVNAAHPQQHVRVSVNGAPLGEMVFDSASPQTRRLSVPAPQAETGHLDLRFDYPDARSGSESGPGEDPHLRALRMVSLTLSPAGAPAAASPG